MMAAVGGCSLLAARIAPLRSEARDPATPRQASILDGVRNARDDVDRPALSVAVRAPQTRA